MSKKKTKAKAPAPAFTPGTLARYQGLRVRVNGFPADPNDYSGSAGNQVARIVKLLEGGSAGSYARVLVSELETDLHTGEPAGN